MIQEYLDRNVRYYNRKDSILKKVEFQNYKAFTSGEIEIKPITILLGANSVGKSSIMQLFLLLQQTALSEYDYKSALKLHGGFVSLGEGSNLLRNKDTSKVFTLSLNFENDGINKYIKEYYYSFCQELVHFIGAVQNMDNSKDTSFFRKLKNIFDTDFPGLRINDKTDEILDSSIIIELIEKASHLLQKHSNQNLIKEVGDKYMFFSGRFKEFIALKDNKEEFLLSYNFLTQLYKKTKDSKYKVSYDIVFVNHNLLIQCVKLYSKDTLLMSFTFDTTSNKLTCFNSSLIDDKLINNKIIQSLQLCFSNCHTIFDFNNSIELNSEKNSKSIFAKTLNQSTEIFFKSLKNFFNDDKINYVSPLRAHPKRYYFLDKAKNSRYVDTLDGDAITEILKNNFSLKKQVNNWLDKFNLHIDVSQLQDIIHKLTVNQNSLQLDITDVGFGISQVLPVIIQGFLSHDNSITLIEQPEIHLHPKMQADLADLFIDIVQYKSKNNISHRKSLIIETHSEYLLKRLRRRISEGIINAEQVAIYLIDPQTSECGAIIKRLDIQNKGAFEWPIDFYGGELLNDTTEFIKNQL